MSLLRLYGTLAVLPVGIALATAPYRIWKWMRAGKQKTEWHPKEAMKNFALLSQAKPEELSARICPKQFYNFLPYLHQGNLGMETRKETETRLSEISDIGAAAVGVVAAAIPVVKYFNTCLSNADAGTCVKIGFEDLYSLSGVQLIAGAYLIAVLAKALLIQPVISMIATDSYQDSRLLLLSIEYKKMLDALNEVLSKSQDDPKFIEAAQVAKQFLRLLPSIEKEIHISLALDTDKVKALLLPLKTACRQILIQQQLKPVVDQGVLTAASQKE